MRVALLNQFGIGLIKPENPKCRMPKKELELIKNMRLVFDYLKSEKKILAPLGSNIQ